MKTSESITICYTPALSEQLHASRVYDDQSRFRKSDKVVACILVAFGVWLIYGGVPWWWSAIAFAAAVGEWFNLLSIRPLQVRVMFRANPKFHEEHELTFSDSGIHFKTNTIDSQINWDHYSKVIESPHIFLLIYGKMMYSVIPKRAFAGGEKLEAFRSLLSKHINGETS